jgi:hypothetical protein
MICCLLFGCSIFVRRTSATLRNTLPPRDFHFLFASATPGPQNSLLEGPGIGVRKFCENLIGPYLRSAASLHYNYFGF